MNELRPTTGEEVFHYVSMDKASYILGSEGDIYCGHSNFMNDKLESWQGCLEILKYLKRCVAPKIYQVIESNLRENSAMAKLMTSGYSYFMPYVWCVTPKRDSAYHWRNYTDKQKGGYCFGFNLQQLRGAIECRNARFGVYSSLYLAPCFYLKEDEDKELIAKFLARFIEILQSDLDNIEENYGTKNAISHVCNVIAAILTLAPLFKDKKWRREEERRLILKKSPVIVGKTYERSHLSDICEHPYNLMSSMTISPHGNQAELVHNLQSKIAIVPDQISFSDVNKTIVDYYITKGKEDIDKDFEEYVVFHAKKDKKAPIMSQEEFFAKPE
jgi:hypothetical protein